MNTKQMTEFRAIKDQCSSGQFRSINVASKARSDAIVAAWDEIERLREELTEAVRIIEQLREAVEEMTTPRWLAHGVPVTK